MGYPIELFRFSFIPSVPFKVYHIFPLRVQNIYYLHVLFVDEDRVRLSGHYPRPYPFHLISDICLEGLPPSWYHLLSGLTQSVVYHKPGISVRLNLDVPLSDVPPLADCHIGIFLSTIHYPGRLILPLVTPHHSQSQAPPPSCHPHYPHIHTQCGSVSLWSNTICVYNITISTSSLQNHTFDFQLSKQM